MHSTRERVSMQRHYCHICCSIYVFYDGVYTSTNTHLKMCVVFMFAYKKDQESLGAAINFCVFFYPSSFEYSTIFFHSVGTKIW